MLQFEECMKSYDMQYCKVCEERWPSKSIHEDGTCDRCRKAAARPIFSAANDMVPMRIGEKHALYGATEAEARDFSLSTALMAV